jgi:hypothetical protein
MVRRASRNALAKLGAPPPCALPTTDDYPRSSLSTDTMVGRQASSGSNHHSRMSAMSCVRCASVPQASFAPPSMVGFRKESIPLLLVPACMDCNNRMGTSHIYREGRFGSGASSLSSPEPRSPEPSVGSARMSVRLADRSAEVISAPCRGASVAAPSQQASAANSSFPC